MSSPKGIYVSPTEFVNFASPKNALAQAIATRERSQSGWYGFMGSLPNPDPVLKAMGRDIEVYRDLRSEPLVGSAIRRRKSAVKALERGLKPEEASDAVVAFIEAMLAGWDIDSIAGQLLDGAFFGYQPAELTWESRNGQLAITRIEGKPPEWFTWDSDNQLRFLARDGGMTGELLPPRKFVVATQDATYDNPYGFADLSMCFWPVMFKKGGWRFWMKFTEKYGTPWLVGKHPRGTSQGEINLLLNSLEAMIEDAVAAIPDDSSVTIVESTGKGDSSGNFKDVINLARSEISIALLGQNQTTEATANKASASAGLEVTRDIDLTTSSDTGDSHTDNKTQLTTPTFTFANIDADVSALSVKLNNVDYAVAKDAGGNWSWTAPVLTDGTYKITATATDLAGNIARSELAFVIDTTVVINNVVMSTDSGYSNSDRLTNDTTPTFDIQVPDDVSHVSVRIDNGSVVDLVKAGGKWIYNCDTLTDGSHSVLISVTDEAGNTTSQQIAFEIDTSLIPISLDLRDNDDTGSSSVDNYTSNKQPLFLFTGIPADAYSLNIQLAGHDYAVSLTTQPVSFKPTTPLPDDNYTLVATLTDKAGNHVETSLSFTVDTVTTVSADFVQGDDSGYSESDNITNKNAPAFEIKVPADVISVTVIEDGISSVVTKNAAGKWMYTSPTLTEGDHVLVVNVVDLAGNTASTSINFTVDMTIEQPIIDLNTSSDSGYSSADNLTNDTTPSFTLSGIDTADIHLVSVTLNGKVYEIKQTGGQWVFELPKADALADGQYEVSVRAEDNAGNTKTGSVTIDIDTHCASPTIALRDSDNSGVTTDSITNKTHPRFLITGAPADLENVAVELNGQSYSVNKTAGYWDIPANINLADGDYALKVTFTDNAGNKGETVYDFTLDTQVLAPAITLIDDSGSNIHDNLTNVNIPRFEIAAGESLSAVTATLNGKSVILTQDAQGKWIYTVDGALGDGTYTVNIDMVDVAGNHAQKDLTFTVDTQIPTPTIDMNDASDSGTSATDNLTNITQPVFTLGNIPADVDTVRLTVGGSVFDAQKDSFGVWTAQPNHLPDGDYTAIVTTTDKAGNAAENRINFTIDTTLVLSVELAPTSDTGVSQSDKLTNDNTPLIQGMADRDAQLTVIVSNTHGTQIASQTVTQLPDGSWSLSLNTLPDGQYTVMVQAKDTAGNSKTESLSFVVDTSTPPPSVALTDSDPNNVHIALGLTPEFRGTAEANATLQIKIDGAAVASVTADGNGSWKWTPPSPLLSGDHLLSVQATDRAGNLSSETTYGVIIPIINIDPPSLMLLSASDSGALGDFITSNTSPTLTGVTIPSTTVTIYVNGTAVGTTQTDSTGRYSYVLAGKAEGTYDVHVSIIDPNDGAPVNSSTAQLVVDTHVEDLHWTIASMGSGGQLSNSTPTISGTSEPGAHLQILVDGKVVIETPTASDGSWSTTLPSLGADGSHTISFNVTDVAGNTKAFGPQTIILDTQITPLIVNLHAADDTGSSASDHITNKTHVTLEGTTEANATVTLCDAIGNVLATVTASATGTWSASVTLVEGNNFFVLQAEDTAGNTSQANITVLCDTSNSITDISLSNNSNSGDIYDLLTNYKTPTVTALTDAGARVDVYVNNVKVSTVTANAAGLAAYTFGNSADGTYNVKFVSTDLAGNIATSKVATLVVDSVIDNFTFASLPALTNAQAQTVSGTGEPGAHIQVSVDGKVAAEGNVEANGRWSIPLVLKTDGDYKIAVTITDTAGNTQTSAEQLVKLDSKTDYPTIVLDTASNSGATTDLITNDKTPSFHGTAEAGAKISILANEIIVATVTADRAGNWSWTQPAALADGEYSFRVVAEDTALNTADSQRLLVVVDTTTEIAVNRFASDNGISITDNVTNVKRPVFEIEGEKGQPIEVRIDGVYIETITLSGRTYLYTVPSALADGSHNISFSITDAAGNKATTGNYGFKIDTLNNTPISLDSVNGESAANRTHNGIIYVNDVSRNLELSGHAESNSRIRITFNDLQVGETWADANGYWSMSVNKIVLAEGEISVKVVSTDRGDNSNTEEFPVIIDTRISQFTVGVADNKSTSADKWAVNTTNNTFYGRGEVGATVTLFMAGVMVAVTTVASDGNWQLSTDSLKEGNQTLTFQITDVAGNTQSADHQVLVDQIAPDSPVVSSSTYIEEAGLWVFTGKSEAGSTLVFTNSSGTEIGTTQADSNGSWNLVLNYPSDGQVSIHAHDATGNNSSEVHIDSMLTHPAIALDSASDTGLVGDMHTTDTTPTFVLSHIESDVTQVTVTLNGHEYFATQEGDHWTFTATEALATGDYTLGVIASDAAGNHSSSDIGFTIDATTPLQSTYHQPDIAPTTGAEHDSPGLSEQQPVQHQDNDSSSPLVIENSQPHLVFDFPAETVAASAEFNGERHELTLNEHHQATFEIPMALPDGPYHVTLNATDAVGNHALHDVSFTVDTSSAQVVASMAEEPRDTHDAPDAESVQAASDHHVSGQQAFAAEMMSTYPVEEHTDDPHAHS